MHISRASNGVASHLISWFRVVAQWTSDPTYVKHSMAFYISGVAAMAVVMAIMSHLRTAFSFQLSIRASRRLHGSLLRRVLYAPVSFFDTTPLGRIVSRFSTDTDEVRRRVGGALEAGKEAAGCAPTV